MITLFPIDKPIFACITNLTISHSGEISCQYAVGTYENEIFTTIANQGFYISPTEASPLLNQQPSDEEKSGSINQILYSRVFQFLKQRGDIKA
ncbi:hypothetical protein [Chromobacterium phragmitis]|uniref:Uncharacterized protein n=1 Tax=Chromobacterium phragmitis TaxID=2202141 RepID=A0A344UPI2_9NEIS|nr:hypothetical protein [Chromobacterium phragmitis]AXE37180.1 hypothetical protein DK843_22795 [Chromobacterium phragmitis]